MKYRDQDLKSEMADEDLSLEGLDQPNAKKQYRRGRPFRTASRPAKKSSKAAQPTVGIAGRRNRRWSW
jgi:hypothetical protein